MFVQYSIDSAIFPLHFHFQDGGARLILNTFSPQPKPTLRGFLDSLVVIRESGLDNRTPGANSLSQLAKV